MSTQQTIQWFPGHMAKAEKQIARDLSLADAVVEILDARIPLSSRNPDLNRLANGKPRILLLNRRDLADPAETARWIDFFHASGKAALDADCRSGKNLSRLLPLIRSTLGDKIAGWKRKGMTGRRIRVMAVGIPNVGKSSLINRLAGSGRAAVQNRPGVTRSTQWFSIGGGCEMMDTPGVLWPKFGDRTVGEHLAFTGAVKEDVCDAEELAPRLLEALCAAGYARTLAERYGLSEDSLAGLDGYGMLELIGRKRGMLAGGGLVDTERAARMVLDEFRAGRLGRITLERAEKT